MLRIVRSLFTLATVLLVLGGIVLVGAQAVALVLGRGAWLEAVPEVVGPPTLISASVAGLLAFVLSYARTPSGTPSEVEDGASQAA
ncbi:hypothetical protein [Kineococcus rhizosphaerae]|uniref:Uncharacterized protein n=1 Tax=Kineococcus rhizosphaerae TaxID=559628 RepID=A0A2T0QY08_9ACTN|nr:hypothetical protein [Kineococcus rhizosphaerae]PRY10834.1 hypothetical protein CLV37_11598 [Kineococcus rhizosphaerae]